MNWYKPVFGFALLNGAFPVMRMNKVTPTANRSFITPLYFFFISISGDLNESEPQTVLGFESLSIFVDNPELKIILPKSQILVLKWESNNKFWGLMSRWIMFLECKYSTPCKSWQNKVLHMLSSKAPSSKISTKLYGAYSKTKAERTWDSAFLRYFPFTMIYLSLMIWGWSSSLNIYASF